MARLIASVAVLIVGLLLMTNACVISSTSCVYEANKKTASALAMHSTGRLSEAATLQAKAASDLEVCLLAHPTVSVASTQRLGELWMYAGEYYAESHNIKTATLALDRAKSIFAKLRSAGNLKGTQLDEVLLDAHEVDEDLRRISRPQH